MGPFQMSPGSHCSHAGCVVQQCIDRALKSGKTGRQNLGSRALPETRPGTAIRIAVRILGARSPPAPLRRFLPAPAGAVAPAGTVVPVVLAVLAALAAGRRRPRAGPGRRHRLALIAAFLLAPISSLGAALAAFRRPSVVAPPCGLFGCTVHGVRGLLLRLAHHVPVQMCEVPHGRGVLPVLESTGHLLASKEVVLVCRIDPAGFLRPFSDEEYVRQQFSRRAHLREA